MLLEREEEIGRLTGAVDEAAAGRGSVAIVTGEAGIGKKSLVAAFARAVEDGGRRVLLAACDDLTAPRTLGPLHDLAGQGSTRLADALSNEAGVGGVLRALLEELHAARPTVLAVEDLHWADDATLDVLAYAYAARRIEATGAVLVLTAREVAPRHPLQRLLGALAGLPVQRLALGPCRRRQLSAWRPVAAAIPASCIGSRAATRSS